MPRIAKYNVSEVLLKVYTKYINKIFIITYLTNIVKQYIILNVNSNIKSLSI